jgi:hypothetical protein
MQFLRQPLSSLVDCFRIFFTPVYHLFRQLLMVRSRCHERQFFQAATVDPDNKKTTYADWLYETGFISDPGDYRSTGPFPDNACAAVTHRNETDLGCVRRVRIRCDPDRPRLSRAAQESGYNKMNQIVLITHRGAGEFDEAAGISRVPAGQEIIEGWYGGPGKLPDLPWVHREFPAPLGRDPLIADDFRSIYRG